MVKSKDVKLSVSPQDDKKADIIISEWIGYALLYRSMSDSVLVAKDRFLRTDSGTVVIGEKGTQSKKEKPIWMVPRMFRHVIYVHEHQHLHRDYHGRYRPSHLPLQSHLHLKTPRPNASSSPYLLNL
ncbi:hypothetical protein K435DRAFT_859756 [Dendrothele bispora CBS 962.96]|uniref:Uncharacterized protein n=1 Tax=Dendrothele bispora (strain CBS 962.96) TaxID=1314807 RepID=A0A4V6T5E3_DENBC|nr:hypothetical protein K435DRAFT_859756 [Dendrothele bispora CBS 962.96]